MATQALFGMGPLAATHALTIVGRHLGIRIGRGLLADVDDRERHDEIVDRNLGHALAVGREMQRRVDVGAGVLVDPPLDQIELVSLA